jgi:hypothetical protein
MGKLLPLLPKPARDHPGLKAARPTGSDLFRGGAVLGAVAVAHVRASTSISQRSRCHNFNRAASSGAARHTLRRMPSLRHRNPSEASAMSHATIFPAILA